MRKACVTYGCVRKRDRTDRIDPQPRPSHLPAFFFVILSDRFARDWRHISVRLQSSATRVLQLVMKFKGKVCLSLPGQVSM